ncbi:hypothetical protein BJ508DRAFT_327776 [Ascobolus immersus RN42]|uniref:Uncharacterized protein n=1 Tax=Ascobolus immersus RN42 TaxID=1160509 RepID=A0A3N4I5H4_ASCIM|nr:hypothetical protein BJ508DRAFT_327776 [Ascobolus immersus RN42]
MTAGLAAITSGKTPSTLLSQVEMLENEMKDLKAQLHNLDEWMSNQEGSLQGIEEVEVGVAGLQKQYSELAQKMNWIRTCLDHDPEFVD